MMTLSPTAKQQHATIAAALARHRIARGQFNSLQSAQGDVGAVRASFPFLRFIDERGDGSCLYRTVARLLYNDPERHRDVRTAAANLLQYEPCAADARDSIATPDGTFVRFSDERMRSGPHFSPDVYASHVQTCLDDEPAAEELWRATADPAAAPPADDIRSALDARRAFVLSPPGIFPDNPARVTWGGEPELILMQLLLGVRIQLLGATPALAPRIISLGGESSSIIADDRACIYLAFASNQHYFTVVTLNDDDIWAELQPILTDDDIWAELQQAHAALDQLGALDTRPTTEQPMLTDDNIWEQLQHTHAAGQQDSIDARPTSTNRHEQPDDHIWAELQAHAALDQVALELTRQTPSMSEQEQQMLEVELEHTAPDASVPLDDGIGAATQRPSRHLDAGHPLAPAPQLIREPRIDDSTVRHLKAYPCCQTQDHPHRHVHGIVGEPSNVLRSSFAVPAYAQTFTRHCVRLCALQVVGGRRGGNWIVTTVPLVGAAEADDSLVVALSFHTAAVDLADACSTHLDQMASVHLFKDRGTLLMYAPAQLASVIESAPDRFRGTRTHHIHDIAELARKVPAAADALEVLALAPSHREYIRLCDELAANESIPHETRQALRTLIDSLSPQSWLVHRAPIARFDIVTHAGSLDLSLLTPTRAALSIADVLVNAVSRVEKKFEQLQRSVNENNSDSAAPPDYAVIRLKSGVAARVWETTSRSYVVDFSVCTCECWRPQRMGVPCAHAEAAAKALGGLPLFGFYAPGMHRDDRHHAFDCDVSLRSQYLE
jgi:hypothetical protein